MAGITFGSINTVVILWAAAIIVFAVLEAVTVQLVSIWFVFGSVAGLVAALLGAPVYVQVIAFIAVSVIALLVTRPLVRKRLKPNVVPTNADRVIGKHGTVFEEINNENGTGLVKVEGQFWSARAEDGEILPPETGVEVLRIEGAKIIVKKA